MSAAAPAVGDAFEKRVRRRVTGREQTFFAVTAPGMEGLCADELLGLEIDVDRRQIETGGVFFHGRLPQAWAAHLWVRTAVHIRMRIAEFSATAFHRLEAELGKIDWELHLPPGPPPEIRVSARRSRLFHSGAIAERTAAAVANRIGTDPSADAPAQKLFVRAEDDRFTISLDMSGEPLYKRGLKVHGGRAPIRETLAAGILMTAGHRPGEPLIDPMCGSGTFSLEAAMMARQIPPGWYRDFAFTRWPGFSRPGWEHLRKTAAKTIRPAARRSVLAVDIDAAAVDGLTRTVAENGLGDTVSAIAGDFFDLDPTRHFAAPGTVVLNPPYGRRLGAPRDTTAFLNRIFDRLMTTYRGWKIAVIAPRQALPVSFPFTVQRTDLSHGGLTTALITGRIPLS